MEVKITALAVKEKEAEEIVRKKLQTIGNLVHSSVPVSENEVRIEVVLSQDEF